MVFHTWREREEGGRVFVGFFFTENLSSMRLCLSADFSLLTNQSKVHAGRPATETQPESSQEAVLLQLLSRANSP